MRRLLAPASPRAHAGLFDPAVGEILGRAHATPYSTRLAALKPCHETAVEPRRLEHQAPVRGHPGRAPRKKIGRLLGSRSPRSESRAPGGLAQNCGAFFAQRSDWCPRRAPLGAGKPRAARSWRATRARSPGARSMRLSAFNPAQAARLPAPASRGYIWRSTRGDRQMKSVRSGRRGERSWRAMPHRSP